METALFPEICISTSGYFSVFQAHIFELETQNWRCCRLFGLSHDHLGRIGSKVNSPTSFLPSLAFPFPLLKWSFFLWSRLEAPVIFGSSLYLDLNSRKLPLAPAILHGNQLSAPSAVASRQPLSLPLHCLSTYHHVFQLSVAPCYTKAKS